MKGKLLLIILSFFVFFAGCPKAISSEKNDIKFLFDQRARKNTLFLTKEERSNIQKNIDALTIEIEKSGSADFLIKRSLEFFWIKKYKECFDDAQSVQKIHDVTDLNHQISLFLMAYCSFFLGEDEFSNKMFDRLIYDVGSVFAKGKMDQSDPYFKFFETVMSNHLSLASIIENNTKMYKPKEQKLVNVKEKEKCVFLNYSNIENEILLWSGICVDGYAEGEGVLSSSEGLIYKGILKKGVFYGYVEIEGPGKFYVKCMIEEGMCEGKGEMRFSTNEYFKGTFLRDKRHGKAAVEFSDGRKYVGEYENERPMEGHKAYCSDGREADYFIYRSFEDGLWNIIFNCK